ncbi:MAG: hypothetical protein EBS83_07990 [Planctomycetia bacterium]|nr:hypothetical protein [Planctomycetia bacterium]
MEKRLVTIRLPATCVPNSIALPLPFLLRNSGHEAKVSGPLLPPLLLGGGDQVAWATPRRIENVPRQFSKRPCLTIPVDSPQGVCEGLTFKTVSPRAEDTMVFNRFGSTTVADISRLLIQMPLRQPLPTTRPRSPPPTPSRSRRPARNSLLNQQRNCPNSPQPKWPTHHHRRLLLRPGNCQLHPPLTALSQW